jgi:hypothetical protein
MSNSRRLAPEKMALFVPQNSPIVSSGLRRFVLCFSPNSNIFSGIKRLTQTSLISRFVRRLRSGHLSELKILIDVEALPVIVLGGPGIDPGVSLS